MIRNFVIKSIYKDFKKSNFSKVLGVKMLMGKKDSNEFFKKCNILLI